METSNILPVINLEEIKREERFFFKKGLQLLLEDKDPKSFSIFLNFVKEDLKRIYRVLDIIYKDKGDRNFYLHLDLARYNNFLSKLEDEEIYLSFFNFGNSKYNPYKKEKDLIKNCMGLLKIY